MATAAQTQDFDWDIVTGENTEFTDIFPTIQWFHGDRRVEKGIAATGGFFVSAEKYPSFEAHGWAEQTFITRDGKRLPGFGTKNAKLAVLRMKKQWIKTDEGKNVPLVHALVCLPDVDEPFVVSLKGASKALAFETAFNQHRAQNVMTANRLRPDGKPPIEPFALWMPVVAGDFVKVSSKANPSSSSDVTEPTLFAPEKVTGEYVRTLYVGKENYLRFAQIYKDTAAWQKQPILAVRDAAPNESDIDTIKDATLKKLLDLCAVKDYSEKDLALTTTNGETDRLENLTEKEAQSALGIVQSY